MQSLCDILKFFHVKTKSICGKAARFNYSSKRSHRKHQLSSLPTELLYTLFTYIPGFSTFNLFWQSHKFWRLVQEFLNLCRSGIHMRTKIRLYLQTAQFVDHFSSLVRSTVKQFSIEELVRLERPKCYKDTFTAFGMTCIL